MAGFIRSGGRWEISGALYDDDDGGQQCTNYARKLRAETRKPLKSARRPSETNRARALLSLAGASLAPRVASSLSVARRRKLRHIAHKLAGKVQLVSLGKT